MGTCEGCGLPMESETVPRRGRPRKYHGATCRKRAERRRKGVPVRSGRKVKATRKKRTSRNSRDPWRRAEVLPIERTLYAGSCLWCGKRIDSAWWPLFEPPDDCFDAFLRRYTDDEPVFDDGQRCWGWDADEETCWEDATEVHHSGNRLCECPCLHCAGSWWPYCSGKCRRLRHQYGMNYVWMPSVGNVRLAIPFAPERRMSRRGWNAQPMFDLYLYEQDPLHGPNDAYYRAKVEVGMIVALPDSAYRRPKSEKVKENEVPETLTEDERRERILTLVSLHGLDGYAATAAVDDPKVYALFEPEYAATA